MIKTVDTMNKFLIMYHREDNDGLFSAAIAEYAITNAIDAKNSTSFAYMPVDYNVLKSINKESIDYWAANYDTVVMTDMSFPDVRMMKYLVDSLGDRLIWIDHHKPAIDASVDNGYDDVPGERATTRSAILLAFKYFFDSDDTMYVNREIPVLFRMLSAWDSFSYEKEGYSLNDVRVLNVGVTQETKLDYDTVYDLVDEIMNDWKTNDVHYSPVIDHFMSVGNTYIQFDEYRWKNVIDTYGDFDWTVDNRPACALFCQDSTSSLIFKTASPNIRNGIVFKHMKNGNWTMSLYNIHNDDTFHCGEYLKKKYNGGGHLGAAGCILTEDQFIDILKAKKI